MGGVEDMVQAAVAFAKANPQWIALIMFGLAFGESLAFISLLLPAWGALVVLGAVIKGSWVDMGVVWTAASVGAALGDWLSYWLGYTLHERVAHLWPLSRHPDLVPRGEAFVRKWGIAAIFIGRFFGPLRAAVPLVAGIFEMPYWQFQVANFASAFVWVAVLLAFGDGLSRAAVYLWGLF